MTTNNPETRPNEPKQAQMSPRVEEYSTKTFGCSLNSNGRAICSNPFEHVYTIIGM